MDNLTHSLAGAALAAAGLRRASPLAAPTLVLAANAPDIDAFIYFFRDEYFALAFRRGWTHGPLAMALLPFLVAGAVLAWDRGIRRRREPGAEPARALPIVLLAIVGVLTHPALDWMNTYGIRLLAPLSMRWFYGDALFIIDPWLWLALGAASFLASAPRGRALVAWLALTAAASALVLAVPLVPAGAKAGWLGGLAAIALARWVTGSADAPATLSIRGLDPRSSRRSATRPADAADAVAGRAARRPGSRATLAAARWALGVAVAYVVLMVGSGRAAARSVRETAHALGIGPVGRVMVAPTPANPFRSTVVVETPGAYHLGTFDWLRNPRARIGTDSILRVPRGPVIDAAAATARARNFLVWSRFPVFVVDTLADGYRVRIGDARYPDRGEAGGLSGLVVRLDRELRPVRR
ncbi:MAG TPA: metal-dependent hydrolase [Longimicrobiales bacterium]